MKVRAVPWSRDFPQPEFREVVLFSRDTDESSLSESIAALTEIPADWRGVIIPAHLADIDLSGWEIDMQPHKVCPVCKTQFYSERGEPVLAKSLQLEKRTLCSFCDDVILEHSPATLHWIAVREADGTLRMLREVAA